jgi:5-methylthioribose kinase
MSKFDKYFLMKDNDAIDYIKEKLDFFTSDSILNCKEIGDGNLNYIFKVWDINSNKSVIVKQAGGVARISDDFKLSTDRNRIESEILKLESKYAPGLVPIIYLYDTVMSCCCMEDLSDHVIMRSALMNHKKFPLFADHISTFMVNTLLLSTDVVMEHKAKKTEVKNYINPELCEITEDLVFTEPYNNKYGRNDVFAPNVEFINTELYNDNELKLEVAKLKFEFLNNAQSLIHGDLHTGSVFIKEDSTKIIDPEFGFYGPMGYDIGNVIANLIFAWVNGDATISDEKEKQDYLKWLESSISDIIDLFSTKFIKVFNENVTDDMAKTEGFGKWYLSTVLSDTAGVCGCEAIRRIVGLAHVKDITSITNENDRVRAERICITIAKKCIKNRCDFMKGNNYIKAIKDAAKLF